MDSARASLRCAGAAALFAVLTFASPHRSEAEAHGNFAVGGVDFAGAEVTPRMEPFDVGRSAPALVALGDKLYMAWRGNHDKFNLVLGRADLATGNLEDKITFPEATVAAPSLLAYGNSLLIAWTGSDSRLRVGQVSFSERRLIPVLELSEKSDLAPSLAAFPDHKIILGWRGLDGRLSFGRVDFGTQRLEDRVVVDEKSQAAPALAVSGGSLFVTWTQKRRLSLGYFNGAPHPLTNRTWAGKFLNLPESSAEAPALAILSGRPFVAWTGTDRARSLNVAAFDLGGRRLTGKVVFPETSHASPALATLAGELRIAWFRNHPGHREIHLRFADRAPRICGIVSVPKVQIYPRGNQPAVVDLFNIVYPEIVALYGEPLSGGTDEVTIYKSPSVSSMYLSHKSGTEAKILAAMMAGYLRLPELAACAVFTEIPDHALFLGPLPDDPVFKHVVTHEVIHPFHDRMDFLGWYDRSWIEEGMTEAAAELVGLRLLRRGSIDVVGRGINRAPWDNLKHYDAWSYPFNGSNHPGFSPLGGLQFFFGGITLFPDPSSNVHLVNRVIDPNVRYAAATSIWLLLTQGFSQDPTHPDFLWRLNDQLERDGIREMANDSSDTLFKEIEKVVGDHQIEGKAVRPWLLDQALLKGPPEDYLFIDVRNPENLDLLHVDPDDPPITLYAAAHESPSISLLGALGRGELAARNCTVTVTIRDFSGEVLVRESGGRTDGDGKYVFQSQFTLDPGAYSIFATADDCNRVYEGFGSSRVPTGLTATTYALVTGKTINGPDSRLLGATVHPAAPDFFPGSRPEIRVVASQTAARIFRPSFRELHPVDQAGAFSAETSPDPASPPSFTDPFAFIPFEIDAAQNGSRGLRNTRTFLKPNPFTRVVWVGSSPDFSLELTPDHGSFEAGGAGTATIRLLPNGVRSGTPLSCPVSAILVPDGSRPPGLKVEVERPEPLSLRAPGATEIAIHFALGSDVPPGTYELEFQAAGLEDCAQVVHSALYRLTVLPRPSQVRVQAVRFAPPAAPADAQAAVTVTTSEGEEEHGTPFDLTVKAGTEFRLMAWPSLQVGNQFFQFIGWELNNDPTQQSSLNPLILTADRDWVVTAQYREVAQPVVFPIPTLAWEGLSMLGAMLVLAGLRILRVGSRRRPSGA
jgi:hypothetical protein